MDIFEYPILPLLKRLRADKEAGFTVGIDSYQTVLKAMDGGYGRGGKEDFTRLCQLLFVKHPDQLQRFTRYLNEAFEEFAQLKKQISTFVEGETNKEKEQPATQSQNQKSSTLAEEKKEDQKESRDKTIAEKEIIDKKEEEPPKTHEPPPPEDIEAPEEKLQLIIEKGIFYRNKITPAYYPASGRDMKQSFRTIRNEYIDLGLLDEIDLATTVEKFARIGLFTDPVYLRRREAINRLIFWIDRGGSMIPFHHLGANLIDAPDERMKKEVYYFRNFPERMVFEKPQLRGRVELEGILRNMDDQCLSVIFSDAGAARGQFSELRLQETDKFIRLLSQSCRRIIWLNPMPVYRWFDSTAEDIAKYLAPMFQLNIQSLRQALRTLKS